MYDLKITKLDTSSEITIGIDAGSKRATGINSLIQKIIKILLTTRGSDSWYPALGGSLKSIVSKPISDENKNDIYRQIAIAIMNTQEYLLKEQVGYNLQDSERLLSLDLIKCYFDTVETRWEIIIQVTTQSNESTLFSIN